MSGSEVPLSHSSDPSHVPHNPGYLDYPDGPHASPAELFELLMENVEDHAIFTVDVTGRISTWNVGAERILGYTDEEIIGQPVARIFTPEDRVNGMSEAELHRARTAGRSDDERWHERKDGSRFWACGTLTALRDDEGELRGYVKILRDFTDRKEAEQAAEQQARLLDLAYDAIFVHDLNNRITFWNLGAEELYGYTRQEAVGQLAPQLLRTEFPASFQATTHALFETGHWQGELIHTCKDGRRVTLSSRWNLQRDQSGHPVAILEINRDITEQKQAQETLARYQAHIEQLNERLQEAMRETNHRIKNNLQLIAALVDLQLFDDVTGDGSARDEALQRLAAHIRAVAGIHEILTREAGEYAQAETISSKDLFDKLCDLFSQTAGPRKIECVAQAVRLTTREASALALITNELVANALKHSAGEVRLDFEVKAGIAVLKVYDDGPGFPPGFDAVQDANTGIELVEAVARRDLDGQVLYENRTGSDGTGACITVTATLARPSPLAGGAAGAATDPAVEENQP